MALTHERPGKQAVVALTLIILVIFKYSFIGAARAAKKKEVRHRALSHPCWMGKSPAVGIQISSLNTSYAT